MNTQNLWRALTLSSLTISLLLLGGCDHGHFQKSGKELTKKAPSASKSGSWITADDTELPRTSSQAESIAIVQAKKPSKTIDRGTPHSQPGTKVVQLAKNVFLEVDGDKRRVLVNAEVCLRQGMLEQLLCKSMTKEHESVLTADVDAKDIHLALLAAGAEAGSPVKFEPKYTLGHGIVARVGIQAKRPIIFGFSIFPAHGTAIKVSLQYEEKGQTITVPAQKWLKNIKTEKELTQDWVFGGSFFYSNDESKLNNPQHYAANDGNVISVANFETSMLDLPIASSADEQNQDVEAWTARIPPVDAPVVVILEPVLPQKKN